MRPAFPSLARTALAYSFTSQSYWCPVPHPNPIPPVNQIPMSMYRWGYYGCNDTVSSCPVVLPYATSATTSASASTITASAIPTAAQVTATMRSDAQISALMTAWDANVASPSAATSAALSASKTAILTGAVSITGLDNTIFNLRFGLLIGSNTFPPTAFIQDSAFSGNLIYYLLQNCSAFAYAPLLKYVTPGGNITCADTTWGLQSGVSAMNSLAYNGYYESRGDRLMPAVAYEVDYQDTSIVAGSPALSKLNLNLFYNKVRMRGPGWVGGHMRRFAPAWMT